MLRPALNGTPLLHDLVRQARRAQGINTATIPFLYSAVEPDSPIAVFRHFVTFLSFDSPVTGEFSESFQAKLLG